MLGKLDFLIGWDMQGEKSREIPPIAISTSWIFLTGRQ